MLEVEAKRRICFQCVQRTRMTLALCRYLCEGHGWLPGEEESCEVGFHLVFLLCVLLHLRENTDKHLLCC